MKSAKIIILAGLLVIAAGCARTVTSIVDFGETMVVEVTLRGTINYNANRYFLVLSDKAAFKIPLPSPYVDLSSPEFLEPGMTPTLGSIEAYYSNYYSTWSGFIEADPAGYELVPGPFILGAATTKESLGNYGTIGAKLNFTFNLAKVFGAALPDKIYFDIVAVPWPDGLAKIPDDHLNSTNAYISKISGSTASFSDPVDESVAAERDILTLQVEIQ